MEIKNNLVESYYRFIARLFEGKVEGLSKDSEVTDIELITNPDGSQFIAFTANGIEEAMPLEMYQEIESIGFEGHINKELSDINLDIEFFNKVIDSSEGYHTKNAKNLIDTLKFNLSRMLDAKEALDNALINKIWL